MNNLKIAIIDYGLGNLKSVARAFEAVGNPAIITSDPEEILKAERLVLPGVGAYEDGMKGLRERGLIDLILKSVKNKKPILGICLGMQLFMTESEEFGLHKGLNIIPGRVIPLKLPKSVNLKWYKVPNFGWCDITPPIGKSVKDWKGTLLNNIKSGSEFYFVHSFYVKPDNKEHILATTVYGNQEVCAVIKKDNVVGCQFHPEKSGKEGLKILKSFCETP